MTKSDFKLSNSNGVIRGKVSKPDGQPVGVLVCLHGSPNGDLHGNTGLFDQLADKVSHLGYVIVQFSMFGSKPSDGHPKDACIRTQLIDYLSIMTFVRTSYDCPVHVVGESAGATIASTKWLPRSEVNSYVLLWPAFDLKDTDLRPYITKEWWDIVDNRGFLEDNGVIIGRELFLELLLTDFAPAFKLPAQDVLILHGQADDEVPYYQSIMALKEARGNVVFITNNNAGHGFKSPPHRAIVLEAIENWLSSIK